MIKEGSLNIILTNDDGINSPGLWAMAEKLKTVADLTMIVPDRDKSGTGASMTLLRPLTVQKVDSRISGILNVYTVDGTPADCVIMADELLCDRKIDLVVSGINAGANLGLDIYNSGTFGAALHGYYRGIDSMAVSVKYIDDVRTGGTGIMYEPSAIVGASLARNLLENKGKRNTLLLNVNLPACDINDIEGVNVTTLGPKAYLENVEPQKHGRRTVYWLRHNNPISEFPLEGTDIWAIEDNRVSVTLINPMNVGSDFINNSCSLRSSMTEALTVSCNPKGSDFSTSEA